MQNLSLTEFLLVRHQLPKEKGVYAIKNQTLGKYYVGQSENMVSRVFSHFSGRGNGDIYHDYKCDHTFEIRFYFYNEHQFRDLNELELHLIRIYECVENGYNRRKGNKTRVGATISTNEY